MRNAVKHTSMIDGCQGREVKQKEKQAGMTRPAFPLYFSKSLTRRHNWHNFHAA
jgi:hypothetical protein